MTEAEFIKYIGKDVVVDYPFQGRVQRWSMKNFHIKDGKIKHKIIGNNTVEFAEIATYL